MSERRITVEWVMITQDGERKWVFGLITPAEFGILNQSRSIQFQGQNWNVGLLTQGEWNSNGLERVTVSLYEPS